MRTLTLRALTVALTTGLAVGAPLPAFALSTHAPDRPSLDRLTTDNQPCDVLTPTPTRSAPTLGAVLSDPDGDPVSGRFEMSWNAPGSTSPSSLTFDTAAKPSGSQFSVSVPRTVPDGPVSWRVQARDAAGDGPWSDEQGQGRCLYVLDTQVPSAPAVSSTDVPLAGDAWLDVMGRYRSFTFSSPSPDVTSYRYTFGAGAPLVTVRPDHPGDPVTVRLTPPRTGVSVLEVRAADGAGNVSAPTRNTLRIATSAGPVSRWKLDDPADSTSAAGAPGVAATIQSGVAFGAEGPSGTPLTGAASFGGTYGDGLRSEATAADPATTFTVSAWVRPEDVGRSMTAVSQSGFLAPSDFALGTAVDDDGNPSFAFSLPAGPAGSGDVDRITGGTPVPGEWSHLTGVQDPVAGTARLYVDGVLAASGDTAVPAGQPLGYVQIGRELESDGIHWTGAWQGDLADVTVWDRLVGPEEIAALGHRTPDRTGYWAMDTVGTNGSSSDTPDAGGRQSLILDGDAHLDTTDPLTGAGSISLDGDGDHLDSDSHQVDTDRSYTVTAQVRLHQSVPDRDMALLSQGGDQADAFTLRYRAADSVWEAVFAHADGAEAQTTTLTGLCFDGTHSLAVQYDSSAGQVRLFLDGSLVDSAPYAAEDAWNAYRPLQVGRDGDGQGGAHHLDGDVDEVRTYAGLLSRAEISELSLPGEHPDL